MEAHTRSLLRLVTAGSVDDGKSTLIGRLLLETRSVFEDQLEAVRRTSERKGLREPDLALLLDGLSAEREQGIAIDVAYRYFETPVRRFIIADCPGHVQCTRNMVTGASTAGCALILLDARLGVLAQSRRHGFLAALLQIPHLVVAVNKMDLVGYQEAVFDRIVEDYRVFAQRLDIPDITCIPVSALRGDNVVDRGGNLAWYQGATLLHHLETLHVPPERNLVDFRFPVQCVLRPGGSFRGFAGRVASGTIRAGEEVVVLPSGAASRVKRIVTFDGDLEEAFAPQSVVLALEDEIDISRGDMLVRRDNQPRATQSLEAVLCWMDEQPLAIGAPYLLKHTTRTVKAFVTRLAYRFDPDTLHRGQAATLAFNDIGRAELRTALPVFADPYPTNRQTGSFILFDPVSNRTVAAGLVRGTGTPAAAGTARALQERRNGHRPAVLWLTGLSGAGKSTLAKAMETRLLGAGCSVVSLDGDSLRAGLCKDLGFSARDRDENIRRAAEVARLLHDAGHLVLCSFISPFQSHRDLARALIPPGRFFEVHVRCSLETCRRRDPKGLYVLADRGELPEFTGVSSPYEEPANPELVVDTESAGVGELVEQIFRRLLESGILGP
jgi:bifunctional enzyme CysN/CysC